MNKKVKRGDKAKTKIKNFFLLLKKYFVCACKFFDDSALNRSDNIFNLMAVYIIVAITILAPAIPEASVNNTIVLQVFTEIIYAIFVLFFIACTILYHKKIIWCWISNFLFITRYITLIDSGASWNRQFTLFYLGLVVIFFCSWISWASAKDINKKGGLVDTVLLAVGLALSIVGFILREGNYEHYKYFIVVGIAIVYLYAISRVLLWIFAPQEKVKFNLLNTIIYVAFYIALLVGLPFLLSYAGVKNDILNGTIIPIYAAAIGGVLTLAGVAWTIRKGDKDRNEDLKRRDKEKNEEARKQLIPYIKMAHGEAVFGAVNASVHGSVQLSSLKKQHFYSFVIDNFYIKNISNSNIILHGILVNDVYFEFSNDKLVEKNTVCQIQTTRNYEYSSEEPLTRLIMIIGDVLDNQYEIECSLVNKPEGIMQVLADDDKEYTGFRSEYVVSSVSLPKLISKENK